MTLKWTQTESDPDYAHYQATLIDGKLFPYYWLGRYLDTDHCVVGFCDEGTDERLVEGLSFNEAKAFAQRHHDEAAG